MLTLISKRILSTDRKYYVFTDKKICHFCFLKYFGILVSWARLWYSARWFIYTERHNQSLSVPSIAYRNIGRVLLFLEQMLICRLQRAEMHPLNIFRKPKLKRISNNNDSKTLKGNNMLLFKFCQVFSTERKDVQTCALSLITWCNKVVFRQERKILF